MHGRHFIVAIAVFFGLAAPAVAKDVPDIRQGADDTAGIGIDVAQIAAGRFHTCALATNGRVFCWGSNGSGQLGDGTTEDRDIPVRVKLLRHVVQIAAGGAHTCAVRDDGRAFCWGANRFGQLGDLTTEDRPRRVRVRGFRRKNIVEVSAGEFFSCARDASGRVYCWGRNNSGQLGNGTTNDSAVRVIVRRLRNVAGIASGAEHSCAVRQDGRSFCWGSNSAGQLGDGTTEDRPLRVRVRRLKNAEFSLPSSGNHSCALHRARQIALCFGNNQTGALGDGTTVDRAVRVRVKRLRNVVQVATGGGHSCAVRDDGRAFCWGWNSSGQLGIGSVDLDAHVLRERVRRISIRGVTQIAAGGSHSCAVDAAGRVYCWGDNSFGQIGSGDSDRKTYSLPFRVRRLGP